MTTPAEDADDDLLAGCLAQALADAEAGRPLDLRALCDGNQHLVPKLAAALGMSAALPALHQQSLGDDGPVTDLLVDRYRLLTVIGRGAAGTVWRARDERLCREVAVKVLHRGLLAGSEATARFTREAITLAAHEHAHIVRVHDQGLTADGCAFLVTELLRGLPLHDVLEASRAQFPAGPSAAAFARTDWLATLLPQADLEATYLRQLVRWAAELGAGLATAHANGVCHRDVKPSNAFVCENGRIVLLDFGIAARAGDASITREHAVLGTPCYMAPEQARGDATASPAVDVYGLGASLYHLLTLAPPHAGDLQQVLLAVRSDDPVPAAKLHPGLPRDLQAVLDTALAKAPQHRYPTMAAMVADLHAFLAHQPLRARPLGLPSRTWRRLQRRPARSLAIGSSLVALLLVGFLLPAWSSLAAHAHAADRWQRLAALPADWCIEGRPDVVALSPLADRRAVLAELDQVLELDAADVSLRVLRGLASLDAGDAERAFADFDAVAAAAPGPYLRAVAERARTATRCEHDVCVLDANALPPPSSVPDHFVAGWLALRAGDADAADALLTTAANDFLPARDLRLLAMLGGKKPDAQRAFAEAKELEGIYGRPTARTRHTLAAALLQQRRYEDAIPYCEDALRLRPDRHGPLNNLALAHLRLGHLEAALAAYEQAVRLKPWLDNSRSGLCQTLRRLQRHDEARAQAMAMQDAGWREFELGNLEVTRAIAALVQGDLADRTAAASAAIVHFTAAAAVSPTTNPKAASVPTSLALARALAGRELGSAILPLLAEMRADPRNPRQIANLAALLAEPDFDPALLPRLRLWLFELAIDLAPGDAELRRQRDLLLQSLRTPR